MSVQQLRGSAQGRMAAQLGTGLERSLSAYAAAAAAAGVSLLALASPTEAKIVYTPAHTNIPVNGGPVPLDLNHDGIVDFSFSNVSYDVTGGFFGFLNARADSPSNALWGRGTFYLGIGEMPAGLLKGGYSGVFAGALRAGFTVRRNKSYFQKGNSRWLMALEGGSYYRSISYGQWNYADNRYLGLKFVENGQIHYGWARLSVSLAHGSSVALTGYAYENIPNKPIITGKTKGPDVITLQPASLGHLAQGAAGISAWRGKN